MNDRADKYFDVDELLHPASAFAHPSEVVNDPDLTLNEKRAILASWASDAASVASNPALRALPGANRIVTIDDVLEPLATLDHHPKGPPGGKPVRYVGIFNDITELWRKNEHLRHLAFHDSLTDLPNRLLLTDRLNQLIAISEREQRCVAVIFLDLNRFKMVA